MEGQSWVRFKVRLKSTKNLCLGHRFFDEIRQIHRFFYIFRQKVQILCRNQARTGRLSCQHIEWLRNFAATAGEQRGLAV